MLNNYIFQITFIVILLGIILSFFKVNSVTELEKRYKNFCVPSLKDETVPFMTRLITLYEKFRNILTKKLIKIKIFDEYSKKYEKYADKSRIIRDNPMDYISNKIICGLGCVLIILLSDILRYKLISFMQIITAFLIGFFIPDFYWKFRQKLRVKQIEKDMLKAIIIMNNSFKSGLSIMQAIYMVSKELDGPIKDEFRKMYIDISFGLEMDLVFKRFADRVGTDDARYITTSLSVLNKTGGNIVQVFASVERNSFTRKKLKEELGALAATSKATFRILVFMPIVLILVIMLLNPSYFAPLFNNTIGLLLLGLILLIYITYIIIVRKVVNIKE